MSSQIDSYRRGKLPREYIIEGSLFGPYMVQYRGELVTPTCYETYELAFAATWEDFKQHKAVPGSLVVSMTRMCSAIQPWIHPVYDGVIEAPDTSIEDWNGRNSEAYYCENQQRARVHWNFSDHQGVDYDALEDLVIVTQEIVALSWRDKVKMFIGEEALENFDRGHLLGKYRRDTLSQCMRSGLDSWRRRLEEIPAIEREGMQIPWTPLEMLLYGAGWALVDTHKSDFLLADYFPELMREVSYPVFGNEPHSLHEVLQKIGKTPAWSPLDVIGYLEDMGL